MSEQGINMVEIVERLARVEVKQETIQADMTEVKGDVKVVVAYVNKQKGQATLLGLLLSGLIAIGGWFGGAHLGR